MSGGGARLAATLDSLRVGIVAVDGAGRVELQNGEASRILGVSRETTRGRALVDALGPGHPAAALLEEVLQTRRDVTSNACALPQRLGGAPLAVDLQASPIGVEDETAGAVLTLIDRTIGRELEALFDQRLHAELYARLAAGIAHEIRNPLSGIRGAAELLEGKLFEPELRRYPALIRAETDRIRRLLDDLAQLTHGGELRPRAANVHEILDGLLALEGHSETWRNVEVERVYDPSLPDLELDADRIAQVFLNLIRNAVDAMEGSGRLTVRTRIEIVHKLATGGAPTARAQVDVEDTGPGIPDEDLPHVFTPFFTRRQGGTGLGLSIAQHWTVRHGGSIQLAPGPAGGTRARVSLPVGKRAE